MKSSRHYIPSKYRYILILLSSHLLSDFTFKLFKIRTSTLLIKEMLGKYGFEKKNIIYSIEKLFSEGRF